VLKLLSKRYTNSVNVLFLRNRSPLTVMTQAIWQNLHARPWNHSICLNVKEKKTVLGKVTCGVILEQPLSGELVKVAYVLLCHNQVKLCDPHFLEAVVHLRK